MGDIHGAQKALEQCLERSGYDFSQDRLIQLGDIVDGYPDVFECIETLLSIKNKILIKGNHDDWFQSFIETELQPANWQHGGKGTLLSYLQHAGKSTTLVPRGQGFSTVLRASDIPQTHRQLFSMQQLYYKDPQGRLFVHGGFDRHLPFALQPPATFYWNRTLFEAALQNDSYYKRGTLPAGFYTDTDTDFTAIYIGHTPTIYWDTDQPIQALNITNLDTGAGHRGRLTILEIAPGTAPPLIKGKNYWQSDPMPELYRQGYR